MMKKLLVAILSLMTIFTLTSCARETETISQRTFALDTLVEIKIYQYVDSPYEEDMIQQAFDYIKKLENILSVHVKESDLYRLKESAGAGSINISEVAYSVIQNSIYYSELTGGQFDVTSGPLIDLWAIDPPDGHVPNDDELNDVLPLIDYTKIEFLGNGEIALKDEGMIINLGAIAKGTIADKVKEFLLDKGVANAMINLGGNVLLIGSKIDGSDFRIGIQDPVEDRGAYLMAVEISDKALVSSGDYERYFEYDGKTYHHILNPETGFPAETNIRQVTIVAPTAEMADGLSTSVLLLGVEKGIELIESLEGVEAIFITKDSKIYVTKGLRDKYEIEESLIEKYTITDNPQDLY